MKVELSNYHLNIKGRREIKGQDIELYVLHLALSANLEVESTEYSGKGNQFYSITLKGTNAHLYAMLIMLQNEHTDAHYTIH